MLKKRNAIFLSTLLIIFTCLPSITYAMNKEESEILVLTNMETKESEYIEITSNSRLSFKTDYYIPNELEKEVIQSRAGEIGIQLVDNPSGFPYCTIGFLEGEFPNGERTYGTATMISKNLAITSAHVIYNSEKGGIAQDLVFIPGLSKNTNSKAQNSVSYTIIPNAYMYEGNDTQDWGLIQFNVDENGKELGDKIGWCGYAFSGDYTTHDGKERMIVGYPSQRYPGMYYARAKIESSSQHYMYYKVETEKGMSGGPILQDDKCIIGIHQRLDINIFEKKGRAVTITQEIFSIINEYRQSIE